MIANTLVGAGVGLANLGVLLFLLEQRQRGAGFATAGALLVFAGRACAHATHGEVLADAAVTAFYAWIWWNSGGGDSTRRRLRSLGRRFAGTRRTAPVLNGS